MNGQKFNEENVKVSIETITPEMAAKWMQANLPHNRTPSKRSVGKICADICGDNWFLNGQSIIFDANGKLIDGQHRLLAIIESGKPVQCVVVRGVDPNCFPTLDSGKSRSLGNIYTTLGENDGLSLAAALSWVDRLERGVSTGGGIRPHEAKAFLDSHSGIRQSMPFKQKSKKLIPGSLFVALHYVFRQINTVLADRFLDAISEGANLDKDDPFLRLRNRLVEATDNKDKQLDQRERLALVIKAWNAKIEGKQIQTLRWDKKREDFPEIAGLKKPEQQKAA